MNLLGIGLGFLGYVLVYAATANHGRFATSPWLGVIGDAYTGEHTNIGQGPQPAPLDGSTSSQPGASALQPNTLGGVSA